MFDDVEKDRDLATLAVPLAGGLDETGSRWEPYRLLDPAGEPVRAAAEFFVDLQARGRSQATVRSYGMDLLRWFRFCWATETPWDRATRAEARDFCRWMLITGKPQRPHWRAPEQQPAAVPSGKAYAPSVRAHCETVLRSFYDYHLEAGTGPVINPFPLDRSRRAGRANTHHNPMEPFRKERAGLYRLRVPSRVPRSVPDEEFNEIFARLPSHRDRALVAFYVSTGARASELLSATQGGTDPGRQLITVIRKGSGELQELPVSTDAFVWLRLYQVEMEELIPKGRRQPLWWTLRRPARPLAYHAGAPDVRAGRAGRRKLGNFARAASHGRLPDGRRPAAPADRCPVRPWPCPVDHDADLPHAPQGGSHPQAPGSSCRAGPAGSTPGRPAAGSRLPARDPASPVRDGRLVTTAIDTTPAVEAAGLPVARQPASSPGQQPPRPPGAAWPATSQDRDAAWERLAGLLFAPAAAKARSDHRLGLRLLLDWLADQPGDTWQDRWLASGADAAGNSWREVTTAWLQDHGHRTGHRQEVMTRTVVAAISADLIRPTPAWLAEANFRKGTLVNALAQTSGNC